MKVVEHKNAKAYIDSLILGMIPCKVVSKDGEMLTAVVTGRKCKVCKAGEVVVLTVNQIVPREVVFGNRVSAYRWV